MFLCVSANPAIDKRMRIGTLLPGHVNRGTDVQPNPGGKAAHVAMVLRVLGDDPLWMGFSGGATGIELTEGLQRIGIRTQPVVIHQPTRVNLEILHGDGSVTEILEPGAAPTETEIALFHSTIKEQFAARQNNLLTIFSGSLPPGVTADFYEQLIRSAQVHHCKTFLDTSGDALRVALAAGPDFVKPNRQEAEALTKEKIIDLPSAVRALKHMLGLGAKSIALSLGAQGLLWSPQTSGVVYFAQPPKVNVRSTVGCGDATVAGFAHAANAGLAPEETVRLAAACGTANCLADAPGCVKPADISALQKETRIERLS